MDNIKKYDLKINDELVRDLRLFFNGNEALKKFNCKFEIDVSNNLSVTLKLKDVGYNEEKALEIELDTGFAKYLNVIGSFNELFNLIELRRDNETVIFKLLLTDEIDMDYMIERATALNEIKGKSDILYNLTMINDFSNDLELYEVLYLLLITPKPVKPKSLDAIKEKLAYYGYDEDNVDLEDGILPVEEHILDLALNKIYNLKKFGDSDLEKGFLFTLYSEFLEWYYEHKIEQ